MDYEKKILICQDSLEGIFTAVYDGWKWSVRGKQIEITTCQPEYPQLFSSCMEIPPDTEKAAKVARSVRRKLGGNTYEAVCYAASSLHPDRGTAVFYVLWKALSQGKCDGRIMEDLSDPAVNLVSSLQVKVWHEIHRFYGFLRFRELGGRVLYARINPQNDILEFLAPHFADRFPNENWMIYDQGRNKVLAHPRGGECTVYRETGPENETGEQMWETDEYEDLWKAFCRYITIPERKNPELQRQFVPLKFRSNMTEF
ncbi:MAG TPA: TIGR03915 family putative DNA repair protein [Candidatus Blautia faecipullorum]|nr:TIGR03915 family putative DNA repair protein [Candidatus Blautia faecipullorum]